MFLFLVRIKISRSCHTWSKTSFAFLVILFCSLPGSEINWSTFLPIKETNPEYLPLLFQVGFFKESLLVEKFTEENAEDKHPSFL